MRLLNAIVAGLALSFASIAVAEGDHLLTPVTGSHNIDLKFYDHAISGSIKDFVVFGNKDGASSELLMKKDGQLIRATFSRNTDSGTTGGTITHQVDGQDHVTTLTFVSASAANNTLSIKVNDEVVTLKIESDGMDGNHYVNPRYTGTYKGETVTWKIENGAACMGCSVHVAFWILGALAH